MKISQDRAKRLAPALEAAMKRRPNDEPPLDVSCRTGAIPIYWDGVGRATETLEAGEQIAREMAENVARAAVKAAQ